MGSQLGEYVGLEFGTRDGFAVGVEDGSCEGKVVLVEKDGIWEGIENSRESEG